MSDWLFFLICALASAPTAAALQLYRSDWPRRRILLVAAAPLPGLALVACVLLFISGATTSREHCGVDACGMAMAISMMGAVGALCAFLLNLAVAAGAQWLMRRR